MTIATPIRKALAAGFTALVLAGPLGAQGGPAPEALTAHLKELSVLHVDFTQTRTVAALSRPLKATGSLVLARDRGVLWQIRRPLNLTYVITASGLREAGTKGRPRAAQDAPVVAQMGKILQSLLQGKWSALAPFFTVRAEGRPEKWRILLAPRAQAAPFLKGLQISGGRHIERVHVDEAGGDALDLVFDHPRTADPLTEAEAGLFAGN